MGSSSAIRIGPGPYDSLDSVEDYLRPFFTIADFQDEEKVTAWCKSAVGLCEEWYKDLFQIQMDNVLIYRGNQWLNQDRATNRFLDRNGAITRRSPRIVINHIFDLVEQWVSRLTRFRPAVQINPANAEYEDKEDARCAKYVIDDIWYRRRIDLFNQAVVRMMKTTGEAYTFIEWDPNSGDLHPDFIKMRKEGNRIPILGPDGEPLTNTETGDPLLIQKSIRVGDVKYTLKPPWHVFEQPCRNRDDIDWVITWDTEDVDYLRAKYPHKANSLKANSNIDVFNSYKLDVGKFKNEVVVYKLYHRSTEFLDGGWYLKFVLGGHETGYAGVLLESNKLPYLHGKLPYTYLGDIKIPDQIRSMSFIQQVFPLQFQLNACASLIYKALVLFTHPKIVMPDGACEITQLADESTVVTYQGGVPPELMKNEPVAQALFQHWQKIEQTLEKLSGIFSLSRGQAPSGVRAAKALRAIEDQEDKRALSTAIEYEDIAVVQNASHTLAVAGQYYSDTDGRLARVVGKNNDYLIKKFKSANLSKPYDIRIESSTALAKSPSARIQEIIELQNVRFGPDAPFTREQFYNFLDFQALDEMKDIATRAVMCAQSENEDLLGENFGAVPFPTPDEDLIQHLKVHYQVPQGRDFKELVPPENKQAFYDHVIATEELVHLKAFGDPMKGKMGNMGFAQQLQLMLPMFPVYFIPPPLPPMMGAGGPMPPPGSAGPPAPVPAGESGVNLSAGGDNQLMSGGGEIMPETAQV